MLFTNHSCDPNIALQGQIVFVAMRDIAAGEELTHDWATTDDADYTLACRCGSAVGRALPHGERALRVAGRLRRGAARYRRPAGRRPATLRRPCDGDANARALAQSPAPPARQR